jgi:tRNA dimethylallyltransferase
MYTDQSSPCLWLLAQSRSEPASFGVARGGKAPPLPPSHHGGARLPTLAAPCLWLRHTVEVTVVLVGPTAAGKSSLAAGLVRRYAVEGRRAEVVNADSMLVYRGMDIGTAKPSEAERAEIRHHMVDLLDIRETATVAEFQQLARGAIDDCRARDVIPIVVGGSALYVRAIVDDFEFPGTDPAVRARLERELVTQGAERLHQRLSDADPLAATRILPGNTRRVIRALEVIELTGRSFTAVLPEHRYRLPDVVQIGIAVDRPTLDARIAARVDAMWAAGFVEEVRQLAATGLRESLTAFRALGYRQVLRYIDGEISEAEARDLTIVGTRRFARRQESWFCKDGRISWLAYDEPDLVSAAYMLAGPAATGSVPDTPAPVVGVED